jgi:signal transduction histidine kinase
VREVAEVMHAVAIPRRLIVQFDLPETPLIAQADPEHLRRIVYHVLYYTARHTPDGQATQIRGRCTIDQVELQFSDAGPALTDSQAARLFQPYQRMTESGSGSPADDGPGLFIARNLAEAHGGRISVTSQPVQGNTFTVSLPVK